MKKTFVKAFVLIGCAWVLWQTIYPPMHSKNTTKHIPVDAYETRAECTTNRQVRYKDFAKDGGRIEEIAISRDGFSLTLTCLPDTVNP